MNYNLITEITGIGSADWDALESLYEKATMYGDFDGLEGLTGEDLFSELVSCINRGCISIMKDEYEASNIISKRIIEFMQDDIYDFIDGLSDCNFMCSHEGLSNMETYNGYDSNWRDVLAEVLWQARAYGRI